MGWAYIVRCADDSYYVGSTVNLPARIAQHNEVGGAKYTSRRRPVVLVWAMEFESIRDAYFAEKQIQNWSRAKREALIEGRIEDLSVLSRGRTGWMSRAPRLSRFAGGVRPLVSSDRSLRSLLDHRWLRRSASGVRPLVSSDPLASLAARPPGLGCLRRTALPRRSRRAVSTTGGCGCLPAYGLWLHGSTTGGCGPRAPYGLVHGSTTGGCGRPACVRPTRPRRRLRAFR